MKHWPRAARDRTRGGFPTPALELTTSARRAIWFDGYVRTCLERDLQDLASISALPGPKQIQWLTSRGQTDFYDDPALVSDAAGRAARHLLRNC